MRSRGPARTSGQEAGSTTVGRDHRRTGRVPERWSGEDCGWFDGRATTGDGMIGWTAAAVRDDEDLALGAVVVPPYEPTPLPLSGAFARRLEGDGAEVG